MLLNMKELSIPFGVYHDVKTLLHDCFSVISPLDVIPYHYIISNISYPVSDHFTLGEVVHSVTASQSGLDNCPRVCDLLCAFTFARTVLEPLRSFLGRPIYVSSWFRCSALNVKVGGVSGSYHMFGRAVDIPASPSEISLINSWCRDNKVKCILYPTFVHVQI